MSDDDITDRIAWPCPECGAAAVRLIPCDPPPFTRLIQLECLVSQSSVGVVSWRYCARTGRFFAQLTFSLPSDSGST